MIHETIQCLPYLSLGHTVYSQQIPPVRRNVTTQGVQDIAVRCFIERAEPLTIPVSSQNERLTRVSRMVLRVIRKRVDLFMLRRIHTTKSMRI
jgi:hypothetical protein